MAVAPRVQTVWNPDGSVEIGVIRHDIDQYVTVPEHLIDDLAIALMDKEPHVPAD